MNIEEILRQISEDLRKLRLSDEARTEREEMTRLMEMNKELENEKPKRRKK